MGIYQTHIPIPHRSCPSHHQFYLLLEHEHSEQWYDTRALTNSTLLTADMSLLCTSKPVPNSWFSFSFLWKNAYYPASSVPQPSHLTSCTPTKYKWYLASSLETVIREPALYKHLTFHVPNLISIFCSLGHLSKDSVQVWGLCKLFVTNLFFMVKGCYPTPNLEDHPLLFDRGCLFNIFAANLYTWRPFLHPQPKDAPCCVNHMVL
jgi:hypothetical protein